VKNMAKLGSLWLLLLISGGAAFRDAQLPICNEDAFQPNYIPKLDALLRWRKFPVRVYFVRDAHHTPERQQLAIEGFQQWTRLTDNKVRFEVVDDEQEAQIWVRFDPSSKAGRTDCTYYPERREIIRAEMIIGVKEDVPLDIQSVSVHEFGHALGIVGHSDDSKDAMYPRYTVGKLASLSQRDLNAVKTAYCELFDEERAIAALERTRGLPSSRDEPRKVQIVCGKPRSSR